jgi:WD40 repeat protein
MNHRAYVWRVRFDRSGERLLSASFDGTAQIWDGHTGKPLFEPIHHGEMVYDALWSDDSSTVLTYGRSNWARLWDAASSRPLGERLSHGSKVDGAVFLSGRRALATCARDGTARLWSVPEAIATPAERAALETSVMTGMELGEDDQVRLLDVSSWRSRREMLEVSRNAPKR